MFADRQPERMRTIYHLCGYFWGAYVENLFCGKATHTLSYNDLFVFTCDPDFTETMFCAAKKYLDNCYPGALNSSVNVYNEYFSSLRDSIDTNNPLHARLLVQRFGADVNYKDCLGNTTLFREVYWRMERKWEGKLK